MNTEIMDVLGRFVEERGGGHSGGQCGGCGGGHGGGQCDGQGSLSADCDNFGDEVRFNYKTVREYDCELVARVDCNLANERIVPARKPCPPCRCRCCKCCRR